MGTAYTSRSKRNSQNATKSVARGDRACCEFSSSDDESRTTMGNDDHDNNSSFSECEDLPLIRSPDDEYFDFHPDPELKAEFDSLVKRIGNKWNGIQSVSSLSHCYGQQEGHRIMMENGNAVMESLRDLESQHYKMLEDENIDFTKMLKDDMHALHQPATSSVKQALTKLVTEGKKKLTLDEPSMDTIYKAAIPIFEEHIQDYNFKLDPNRNNVLPKKLANGGNDRIYKILLRMRHCLIKDRQQDDLKKKLNKSHKKEVHDLQQKIDKLQLDNMDLKRQLDNANQENANLQVGLQRAEANAEANSNKAQFTESSHDYVTPLKSNDTNIKNENQSLRQRIAELEDLRAGVATSLASNNVRMEQHGTFHYTIVNTPNTPSRREIPKNEED
ncbi:predicted protein [Chaetoceros tenuissimus]|uniref:Uncharacterized protein n=1 Tax=Chaetoceros tenuissimus TaxID=426638 RepID=A0AAD3D3G9_9STRA|nr:predicted protein [Chaetoceros tenuissimus]